MLQARRDLDLPQEPLGPEADCDVRMEHLDRHRAVVSQVLRQIHGRHASPADLALDLAAVGYRGSEATEELYHAYPKLHARPPGGTGVLAPPFTSLTHQSPEANSTQQRRDPRVRTQVVHERPCLEVRQPM